MPPSALLQAAGQRGVDRLVVTDHNTIRGALAAQRLDPTRVIVGEEILTTRGEILAAFVQEEVPPHLSPAETIRRLRAQNAWISVSHPFDTARHGWQLPDLLEIAPLVDAVEVFNARCLSPRLNILAAQFAREHNLAGTAGSDAHLALEVGRAVLVLPPFEDYASLKAAMPTARVEGRLSSPLVRLGSTFAKLANKGRHSHSPG